mmetsp:Transcript_26577/g.51104  ORF Transcript_26577/g.51104 Transcript_26577/m.51104 type:complete len:160 (-) Transcript_26577:1345-1824(-)
MPQSGKRVSSYNLFVVNGNYALQQLIDRITPALATCLLQKHQSRQNNLAALFSETVKRCCFFMSNRAFILNAAQSAHDGSRYRCNHQEAHCGQVAYCLRRQWHGTTPPLAAHRNLDEYREKEASLGLPRSEPNHEGATSRQWAPLPTNSGHPSKSVHSP